MNILIPMAGAGSRFKIKGFDVPKPLIKIGEECLVEKSISGKSSLTRLWSSFFELRSILCIISFPFFLIVSVTVIPKSADIFIE